MGDVVTIVETKMPRRPLTIADYAALPEEIFERAELQEGSLIMSPQPTMGHNQAVGELRETLRRAVPDDLLAIHEVDVDLQLAQPDGPATVRAPDVCVLTRVGYDRVGREGGFLRASEAVLVVEVVSPNSRRTDRLVKLAEYADAGIEHYWIVDLDGGPSLIAGRLVDGRYEQSEPITGGFTTDVPFPVDVDLDGLV